MVTNYDGRVISALVEAQTSQSDGRRDAGPCPGFVPTEQSTRVYASSGTVMLPGVMASSMIIRAGRRRVDRPTVASPSDRRKWRVARAALLPPRASDGGLRHLM